MFKRTFTVTFRPLQNNFILLPENYFSIVSTYDTGCLSLQYGTHVHYMSWAHLAGALMNNEIGINARSAKEMGLKEYDLVNCTLIEDVTALLKVYSTPASLKDWEIIEMSSETVANNILEQTQIINASQMLVVWINQSLVVTVSIDRLKPDINYGRLTHATKFIITPNAYKGLNNVVPTPYGILRDNTANMLVSTLNSKTGRPFVKAFKLSSQAIWKEYIERVKRDLRKENTNQVEFRVMTGAWVQNYQLGDAYVYSLKRAKYTQPNIIYSLRTNGDREFFVNLHVISCESESYNENCLNRTIFLNGSLMELLNLNQFEKVILQPKSFTANFVEKIELFAHKKTHYKVVENAFKRYVLTQAHQSFMLLNQEEILRLEDDLMVTVNLFPHHFRYCVIDAGFLKEGKIYAADVVRNVPASLNGDISHGKKRTYLQMNESDIIKLRCFDVFVTELLKRLKTNHCLGTLSAVERQGNVILAGPAGSGKSVVIHRALEELTNHPFNCFYDIFHCKRGKGRKVESLQRDLRQVFVNCMQHTPAIIVLENLDVIAHEVNSEQAHQDAEYYNRIADIVHQLITQFTRNNAIAVIATVNSLNSLNKRIYAARGRHIFHSLLHIPRLEFNDRVQILRDLFLHINTSSIDFAEYAKLTEGYNQSDLIEFVKRGTFYAYRINKTTPTLTSAHLNASIIHTNPNCIEGIKTLKKSLSITRKDAIQVEEIPGLESVLTVLEEVLKWPVEYSDIYKELPLRREAGVLLFGPPGTGKSFLVSRMLSSWNIRVISVKGPELLAKYIGQSEENVRNIFNRARSIQPCVLFFDEFDSLASKRGHDSTGVTDRVVNQLLTEIDGVGSLEGVVIIAATSRPELLDPALIRSGRIGRIVECPMPDTLARQRIFKVLSVNLCLDESVNFKYLAVQTHNFTGADIQSIITSANMLAIKEAVVSEGKEISSNVIITQKHLIEALEKTRPSLSTDEIAKYQKIYGQFTNMQRGNRDIVAKRTTLA